MAITKIGSRLLDRYFTEEGKDVLGTVKWEKRRAYIYDAKKDKALLDLEVEAPDFWSDTAVNIAAYKYLRKRGVPTPEGRETSIRQLIDRVALAITRAGEELGYFESLDESKIFRDEFYPLVSYRFYSWSS